MTRDPARAVRAALRRSLFGCAEKARSRKFVAVVVCRPGAGLEPALSAGH
jgi:hypothetical protein